MTELEIYGDLLTLFNARFGRDYGWSLRKLSTDTFLVEDKGTRGRFRIVALSRPATKATLFRDFSAATADFADEATRYLVANGDASGLWAFEGAAA